MSCPNKKPTGTPNRIVHITTVTNLDDKSLKAICGFLPKSSIYFFASAFSAPSSSWYKSRHLLKEDKQPQLQEASKIIFSASRDCHMSDSLFASLAKERFAFARFFKSVIDSKKVSSSWEEWKSDIAHHETGLLWSKAKRIWQHDYNTNRRDLRDIFKLYCYYTNEKQVIDFIDISPEMAAKITDEDLCAVLMMWFLFSEEKPKEFYLTSCAGIIGHGLEPIRLFPSLEIIDLSKGESTEWNIPVPVEERAVVPFLDELVSSMADDHLLRVKVPSEWNKYLARDESEDESNESEEDEDDNDDSVSVHQSFMSLLKTHKNASNRDSSCCYFGFEGSSRTLIISMAENDQFTHVDECIFCTISGNCNRHQSTRFIACEHCSKVECCFCRDPPTLGDNKAIWKCEQCGITTCYCCRRKSYGQGDSIVSSCHPTHPHFKCDFIPTWDPDLLRLLGDGSTHGFMQQMERFRERNHILCGSCRFKKCCNFDSRRCTTCLGWSFGKLLQVASERKDQIQSLKDEINSLEEEHRRMENQNKKRRKGKSHENNVLV